MMEIKDLVSRFQIEGEFVSGEGHGSGHINSTVKVETTETLYILQRVNTNAFKDAAGLMNNIALVTNFLAERETDPRRVMRLIPTKDGGNYTTDDEGGVWRMYSFVQGGLSLDKAETENDFYQSGVAFGRFQADLDQFPAETLVETIPHFHDTPDRFRLFHEAIENNLSGRLDQCRDEIAFALAREKDASVLTDLLAAGELPLRVTHNDTKLNNVILDAETREPLCVVDLDTVMPGLAAYDYGDSIRFGASTALEDEKDLDKVHFSLSLFESYTRGYMEACGKMLTAKEIETLHWGAKMMTLECGTRFLTDFLNGDTYFGTAYPEHNLVRTRTQFRLVSEMEEHWDEMQKIVLKYR